MTLTNPRSSVSFDPAHDVVTVSLFDAKTSVGATVELSPEGTAALITALVNATPGARHPNRPASPTRATRSSFHLRLPPVAELKGLPAIRRR